MDNKQLFSLHHDLSDALFTVHNELKRRNITWQTYADNGLRALATIRYREMNGGTLMNAKNTIDAYFSV